MPQQDSKTNKQTSARLVLLAQLPPFPNNKYNKQQTQQQKSQTNLRQAGVVSPTAPLSISATRNFPAEHEIRSHQAFPFHLKCGDGL